MNTTNLKEKIEAQNLSDEIFRKHIAKVLELINNFTGKVFKVDGSFTKAFSEAIKTLELPKGTMIYKSFSSLYFKTSASVLVNPKEAWMSHTAVYGDTSVFLGGVGNNGELEIAPYLEGHVSEIVNRDPYNFEKIKADLKEVEEIREKLETATQKIPYFLK